MLSAKELLKVEEGFEKIALEELEPFLKSIEKSGTFQSFDNTKIAYREYINPEAKAEVMLIHGFSEFTEKYNEMIYNLYENGFSVYISDLRGHGDSDRFVDDPSMVDVKRFTDYVEDIRCFYMLSIRDSKLPKFLLGHSMGGAIAILYMEKHCEDFERVIFSSPMVRMQTGKYPFWSCCLISALVKLFGKGKRFAAGQHGFNPESRLKQSSCKSPERYEYIMNMRRNYVRNQTWGGSYNWTYAASKCSYYILKDSHVKNIKVPALVLRAGNDHLVRSEFIQIFADKLPSGKCVFFPEARHEIYHGTLDEREKFYSEVMEFFNV